MDALISDMRFAIRSLAKAKLFTIVALTSLALGIGANVTVFSLVNAIAFKPLPFAEPDRLVDLHEWSATKLCSGCGVGTSIADVRRLARRTRGRSPRWARTRAALRCFRHRDGGAHRRRRRVGERSSICSAFTPVLGRTFQRGRRSRRRRARRVAQRRALDAPVRRATAASSDRRFA